MRPSQIDPELFRQAIAENDREDAQADQKARKKLEDPKLRALLAQHRPELLTPPPAPPRRDTR